MTSYLRPILVLLACIGLMPAAWALEADIHPSSNSSLAHIEELRTLSRQTPLMLVRFNQPNIQYNASLKRLLSQLQQMQKEGSRFMVTIVGHIPTTQDAHFTEKSQFFLSEHVGYMQQMLETHYIPSDHIREYIVMGSSSGFNEIRLYVHPIPHG